MHPPSVPVPEAFRIEVVVARGPNNAPRGLSINISERACRSTLRLLNIVSVSFAIVWVCVCGLEKLERIVELYLTTLPVSMTEAPTWGEWRVPWSILPPN